MTKEIKVGSHIVISQPGEDYICKVIEIRKNPKVNGLQMNYYLLDDSWEPTK